MSVHKNLTTLKTNFMEADGLGTSLHNWSLQKIVNQNLTWGKYVTWQWQQQQNYVLREHLHMCDIRCFGGYIFLTSLCKYPNQIFYYIHIAYLVKSHSAWLKIRRHMWMLPLVWGCPICTQPKNRCNIWNLSIFLDYEKSYKHDCKAKSSSFFRDDERKNIM